MHVYGKNSGILNEESFVWAKRISWLDPGLQRIGQKPWESEDDGLKMLAEGISFNQSLESVCWT
jgi:hypothetical protein